jgi:hypothetical protein
MMYVLVFSKNLPDPKIRAPTTASPSAPMTKAPIAVLLVCSFTVVTSLLHDRRRPALVTPMDVSSVQPDDNGCGPDRAAIPAPF